MTRITRTILLAGALSALAAPVAYGHAEIDKYSPKRGSTVSKSLSSVSVTFDEAVVGGTLTVRHDGEKVSKKSKLTNGKKTLRAAVSGLHSGTYKVKVTWIADDGDKQTKRYSFKVR